MNTKAVQPANRFSTRPSAIVATAFATMLLILASAGKAAEADNRITILQLSRPAGSENSSVFRNRGRETSSWGKRKLTP